MARSVIQQITIVKYENDNLWVRHESEGIKDSYHPRTLKGAVNAVENILLGFEPARNDILYNPETPVLHTNSGQKPEKICYSTESRILQARAQILELKAKVEEDPDHRRFLDAKAQKLKSDAKRILAAKPKH